MLCGLSPVTHSSVGAPGKLKWVTSLGPGPQRWRGEGEGSRWCSLHAHASPESTLMEVQDRKCACGRRKISVPAGRPSSRLVRRSTARASVSKPEQCCHRAAVFFFFGQEGVCYEKAWLGCTLPGRDSSNSLKDSSYKQYRGSGEGGEVAWSLPRPVAGPGGGEKEARQWTQRKAPLEAWSSTPMERL